ncbi:phosphotransferase [Rothia sp. LK2492]|uniref:phosphotransferase n=1 Tax=Rothia sp. LK2492 TaxID=3114370 RepID=UPI0034CF9737
MSANTTALEALRRYHRTSPVRRAWPAKDGALIFETFDTQGLLRAGKVTAEGNISLLIYGADKKLPWLEAVVDGGAQLLVHRAGKRAVTREHHAVTKHLRPGKAEKVAALSSSLGEVFEEAGFSSASVLAVREQSLDFSLLPGQTLLELGDDSLPAWEVFADSWKRFLTLGKDLADVTHYPLHGSVEEKRVLAQWIESARNFAALDRINDLEGAAEAVATALAEKPDQPVLLHRDLHDKQLLWNGSQLGILDIDTAAIGEAALDVGNLLAHIELRRIQGHLTAKKAAEITVILWDLAQEAGISSQRLRAYTQGSRIRITCVYAFRPRSAPWLATWLDWALAHTPSVF